MLEFLPIILLVVSGILHVTYVLIALLFQSENKGKPVRDNYTVRHIVCFHNESAFIKRKLENCYNINYPNIAHTFVNDNSSDNTFELLQKHQGTNTRIINNKKNFGKNLSQINAVNTSKSDLILFTDANVFLDENALSELQTYFDKETGGVTGNVIVQTESGKIEFSGKYWNLEKRIKQFQTNFGSVIGFDGGFYCVKRTNYNVKRENELSDFETAFLIFEQQKKVQYASNAKAVEIEKRTLKSSFKARMRASNRVFWSYKRIFKYIKRLKKRVIIHFVFHKLLRYFFLIFFVLCLPQITFNLYMFFPWSLVLILFPFVFRFILESIALFYGGIIAITGKEITSWSDKKI